MIKRMCFICEKVKSDIYWSMICGWECWVCPQCAEELLKKDALIRTERTCRLCCGFIKKEDTDRYLAVYDINTPLLEVLESEEFEKTDMPFFTEKKYRGEEYSDVWKADGEMNFSVPICYECKQKFSADRLEYQKEWKKETVM